MTNNSGVLARKLAAQYAVQAPMPDIPEFDMPLPSTIDPVQRAWRICLARAARAHMKLALGFETLQSDTVGLVEVLESPMERALILMLEGTGDALGLMVISPPVLSGMIEMLTLSHLSPELELRSPTRTDAAMVVDMIDAALANFAQMMAEQGDPLWSQSFHFAAMIDDPRPLHLMMDEGDYGILRAELHLEHGARQGGIMLALPVAAAPAMDFGLPAMADESLGGLMGQDDDFTQEFAQHIGLVPTHLDAVLAQISLPLDRILRMQVGEVLALDGAALDAIAVMGINNVALGGGKLGQHRGMRAVRLNELEFEHQQDAADQGTAAPLGSSAEMPLAQPDQPQLAPAGMALPADFSVDLMQAG